MVKERLKKLGDLLFFLLFLAFAYYGELLIANLTSSPWGRDLHFRGFHLYWLKGVWGLLVLPLLLAVYFARNQVKSWFRPGRLRVDMRHLAVLAILPLFFIQRPPFIWMMLRNLSWFSLLVWYNLFSAFYKEPQSIKVELADPGPLAEQ